MTEQELHHLAAGFVETVDALSERDRLRDEVARLNARVKTLENSAKINGSVAKQRGEETKRLRDVLVAVKLGAEYPDELGDMINAALSTGD